MLVQKFTTLFITLSACTALFIEHEAYAACTNPPVIGCTTAMGCNPPVEGIFELKPGQITINYHDQCGTEDATRVYARTGMSGAFAQIKLENSSSSGWRTATHANLDAGQTYCFMVQTQEGATLRNSAHRCVVTPAAACNPPVIGYEEGGVPAFPFVSADSIGVQYHDQCGSDRATTIFARRFGTSAWTAIHSETGPKPGWRTATHASLDADTSYCFTAATTGPDDHVSYSEQRCVRTAPAFQNVVLTAPESLEVLASFEWHDTHPLPEGTPEAPALYYMNILLEEETTVMALRQLGLHVQADPLFVPELTGYTDASTLIYGSSSLPAGRWYFAVVSGAVYNALRTDSIASVERGEGANIPAMVLRRIPVSAARFGSAYRLSPVHLTENGFEHNGLPRQVCFPYDGGEACQIQQELGGWIARKVITISYEALDYAAEATRDLLGQVSRRLEGEVNLTVQFRLLNTDPLFMPNRSANSFLTSGWSGQELYLANTKVRIRQGYTSFSGKTNSTGRISLPISKNNATGICFELDSEFVKITQHVATKELCVHSADSGYATSHEMEIQVKDSRANVFAQVNDAGRYLKTVFGHTPAKMTMLIGDAADRLATQDVAFAGCMGRIPNLVLSGAADVLLGFLHPTLITGSLSAEYLYSVDIVLPRDNEASRGVATHEYGHAAMCSLLGAGHVQTAWTQVILQSATHAPNDEASYIAEAFADFITAQVAGGTNYFAVPDSRESLGVNYADRDGDGLEHNYTDADLSGSLKPEYHAKVRRVAALLHDAFDGHNGAATQPNDAQHWDYDYTDSYLVHETSNGTAADDDPVSLDGRCLPRIFQRWREQASLLSEGTFLRALAQTMIANGATRDETCEVFKKHAPSCPSYVANLSTVPGSDPCVSPSSGNGGGGGGGSHDPSEPPPVVN
jgi:hypothetical protein